MTTPTDDTILDVEVEYAIEPYRAILPPEALDVLRAALIEAYTEHPAGQRILHHIREEAKSIDRSGDIPTLKGKEGVSEERMAIEARLFRGNRR